MSFNTQPPEGGWACRVRPRSLGERGFNTQPPEGGWQIMENRETTDKVSTRSRLKAAGTLCRQKRGRCYGFNTQPPEGGWV